MKIYITLKLVYMENRMREKEKKEGYGKQVKKQFKNILKINLIIGKK